MNITCKVERVIYLNTAHSLTLQDRLMAHNSNEHERQDQSGPSATINKAHKYSLEGGVEITPL